MWWKLIGGIVGSLVKKPESMYVEPEHENTQVKVISVIATGVIVGYLLKKIL